MWRNNLSSTCLKWMLFLALCALSSAVARRRLWSVHHIITIIIIITHQLQTLLPLVPPPAPLPIKHIVGTLFVKVPGLGEGSPLPHHLRHWGHHLRHCCQRLLEGYYHHGVASYLRGHYYLVWRWSDMDRTLRGGKSISHLVFDEGYTLIDRKLWPLICVTILILAILAGENFGETNLNTYITY